jgi:hypothetical protein
MSTDGRSSDPTMGGFDGSGPTALATGVAPSVRHRTRMKASSSTPAEAFPRLPRGIEGYGGTDAEGPKEGVVMARTRFEVVPEGDQWIVREGKKSTPPLDTVDLAVSAAIRRAQESAPSEVVIVHEDGTLEEARTFGDADAS